MVRISDHALLRFLERAGGFDIEGTRTAIESSLERASDAAETMGASDLLIVVDGLCFIVRSGTVTTVLEQGSPAMNAAVLTGPRVAR